MLFDIIHVIVFAYLVVFYFNIKISEGETLKGKRTFKREIKKVLDNGESAPLDQVYLVVKSEEKKLLTRYGCEYIYSKSYHLNELTDEKMESVFTELENNIKNQIQNYGKAN